MGCGTSKIQIMRPEQRGLPRQTPFPLSPFQKTIIKASWTQLQSRGLEFGTGIFIRLFAEYFEMTSQFPEFKGLRSVDELKEWTELQGHPRKIFCAFDEAVTSIDDGNLFISKMEKLGEKHSEDIKDEYLKRMGKAVVQTVMEIIAEDQRDPHLVEAWSDLFRFIAQLLKVGIQRRKAMKM